MKIQCNVCEVAEATVLCCADEAALCSACDEKIHAANKLASKHPRVPLANSSSHMPKCDICQDSIGYFFCLQDRALLCRKCDLAIHNANPYVSSHQRFLLTGVRVGAESPDLGSCSMGRSPSVDKVSDTDTRSVSQITAPMTMAGQYEKAVSACTSFGNLTPTKRSAPMEMVEDYAKEIPAEGRNVGDYTQQRVSFSGGPGSAAQWQLDDFLGFSECYQNFGYTDQGSSKADSGKSGGSDPSSFARTSSEDDLDIDDERLGQVPEMGRNLFKTPSPPTATGLFWPRTSHEFAPSTAHFVPDVSFPDEHNSHHHYPRNSYTNTRRRHY